MLVELYEIKGQCIQVNRTLLAGLTITQNKYILSFTSLCLYFHKPSFTPVIMYSQFWCYLFKAWLHSESYLHICTGSYRARVPRVS